MGSYEDTISVLEAELAAVEQVFAGLSDDEWRLPTKLVPVDPGLPYWTVFELAGHFDGHPVPAAEVHHRARPGHAQPGPYGAGAVVHARVDHARVVAALVRADPVLLLQHRDCRLWTVEEQPMRHGEADDARPDDDVPAHSSKATCSTSRGRAIRTDRSEAISASPPAT